jgi:hypothetical protein
MRMLKTLIKCLLTVSLAAGSVAVFADDDDHAFTDGAVMVVSSIRTKPGMFDEYLKFLDGPYKKTMEEEKKAGIILDYSVWQAFPRTPHDPDLYLTIVFKNWAAFDGLREREEPIEKKVWGSLSASDKASIDREKIREVLGSQVIQEAKLK